MLIVQRNYDDKINTRPVLQSISQYALWVGGVGGWAEGVGILMEVQAAASDNKLLCFPQRTMCLRIGRMSCKHLFWFFFIFG